MTDEIMIQEICRTLQMESASIGQLADDLDMDTMVSIVKLLGDTSGKIVTTGCGTSAAAARKIAHSLCCVGRPALFLSPSDAVHGGLGVVKEGDILVLISKGGNTGELAAVAEAGRTLKATLIGVTENPDSMIGRISDLCLKVRVDREPCRFNMLATASTLAVVSAFDSICIALMAYTGYTREQFAVIHPGGAVGKRLLQKEGQ